MCSIIQHFAGDRVRLLQLSEVKARKLEPPPFAVCPKGTKIYEDRLRTSPEPATVTGDGPVLAQQSQNRHYRKNGPMQQVPFHGTLGLSLDDEASFDALCSWPKPRQDNTRHGWAKNPQRRLILGLNTNQIHAFCGEVTSADVLPAHVVCTDMGGRHGHLQSRLIPQLVVMGRLN